MIILKTIIKSNRGSTTFNVLLFTMLLVFVVFPIFSVVFDKHVLLVKAQSIKDSIDITNISTYKVMKTTDKSKEIIVMDQVQLLEAYKMLLAKNMNLNPDMTPKEKSIAQGPVIIDSLIIYPKGILFPITCPMGKEIKRPTVHAVVKVPVKPSLYRQILLTALSKDYVELIIHVDSDIPVNNPGNN